MCNTTTKSCRPTGFESAACGLPIRYSITYIIYFRLRVQLRESDVMIQRMKSEYNFVSQGGILQSMQVWHL